MSEYYGLRDAAGLFITEGTSTSPDGLGYSRIRGIYNDELVNGWQLSTELDMSTFYSPGEKG